MTRAGYITDRRCPANPDHGLLLDMRDGGYYCPHAEHYSGIVTKSFWSEDEFEQVKSNPYSNPAPASKPDPLKPVAIPKRSNRSAGKTVNSQNRVRPAVSNRKSNRNTR